MGELKRSDSPNMLGEAGQAGLRFIVEDLSSKVLQRVKLLEAKEERVHNLRGRLGQLRQELVDQQAAMERSKREAFVDEIRIREAERAVARAEEKTVSASDGPLSARQERDAARETVVQLTLRVEILSAMVGATAAGGALREQSARLDKLITMVSKELQRLEQSHRRLLEAKAVLDAASESTGGRDARLRYELEKRWLELAVSLDSLSLQTLPTKRSPTAVAECDGDLLEDAERRLHSLHKFCSSAEEIISTID